MCRRSVGSTRAGSCRRRFRLRDFEPRLWRAYAFARFSFPVAVRLNRFEAARLVLIFGILYSLLRETGRFVAVARVVGGPLVAPVDCAFAAPVVGAFAPPA